MGMGSENAMSAPMANTVARLSGLEGILWKVAKLLQAPIVPAIRNMEVPTAYDRLLLLYVSCAEAYHASLRGSLAVPETGP